MRLNIATLRKVYIIHRQESKIQEVEFTPLLTDSPAVAKFKVSAAPPTASNSMLMCA